MPYHCSAVRSLRSPFTYALPAAHFMYAAFLTDAPVAYAFLRGCSTRFVLLALAYADDTFRSLPPPGIFSSITFVRDTLTRRFFARGFARLHSYVMRFGCMFARRDIFISAVFLPHWFVLRRWTFRHYRPRRDIRVGCLTAARISAVYAHADIVLVLYVAFALRVLTL